MSHSAAVSSHVSALPQIRRHAPRRLSRRQVEALLYDAVAAAIGVEIAQKPAEPRRRAVAARTRVLETA